MATTMNKLNSKNGIDLFEIVMNATGKVVSYEIYMDGEYMSRFTNKREATSVWKDFAGC